MSQKNNNNPSANPRPSSLYSARSAQPSTSGAQGQSHSGQGQAQGQAAPTVPKRRESLPVLSSSLPGTITSNTEGASLSYGPVLKHPRQSLNVVRSAPNMEECVKAISVNKHVFEDKTHHKESFGFLKDFYDSNSLCDLEVQCGQRTFKCHKVILACISKYFRSMFQSDMVESRQSVVTIKDIDERAMEAIIDFAYTSKVSMDVDDVQNLLYASSILQVEAVAIACCEFMKTQLDPQNCIGVRTFAEQHGRTDLVRKTDQFILENFEDVVVNDEFVSITPKTLISLVESSDLNVRNETDAFEAMMKWVRHDVEGRNQYLPELLANVRLPLIAASHLIEVVKITVMIF